MVTSVNLNMMLKAITITPLPNKAIYMRQNSALFQQNYARSQNEQVLFGKYTKLIGQMPLIR